MADPQTEKKIMDATLQPMPIQVHAQYVKDFSFENPNAPESLRMAESVPNIDVNLVLDAIKINDDQIADLYESSLTMKIHSTKDSQTLFIAEITYCALVSFKDLSPANAQYILYVEVPQMLFPFARQMVANAVTAGGQPQLLLKPIDFRAMYASKIKQAQETAA